MTAAGTVTLLFTDTEMGVPISAELVARELGL
jgi:hypothetical protein